MLKMKITYSIASSSYFLTKLFLEEVFNVEFSHIPRELLKEKSYISKISRFIYSSFPKNYSYFAFYVCEREFQRLKINCGQWDKIEINKIPLSTSSIEIQGILVSHGCLFPSTNTI